MTVRGVVSGSLGLSAAIGLALVAGGIVPWGVRAVALFTLLGFAWLFLLIALLSADVYRRLGL